MKTPKPVLFIVLDGWGLSPETQHNAVALGKTPVWDGIWQKYPSTTLNACGEAVGLPAGTIGNSEVGHMNIGAGRVVYQDLSRINKAIREGSFFENPVLLSLVKNLRETGGALHLMGLLSDGGVHSHIEHLFALLDFAKRQNVRKVFIHCFTDGRDTPPDAGKTYLRKLERKITETGNAAIATVIGRYYAMDRDKRWERTRKAREAIVLGRGVGAESAARAIEASYAAGVTDEFVLPAVIEEGGKPVGVLKPEDAVLFFNFRADRTRQLTRALNEKNAPAFFATMTRYEKGFPYPVVFEPQNLDNVFGKVTSDHGLKQFRIAETEKYAHVTYFFNGGREIEFPGEERLLIPSPKEVATYDLKPEMSARAVTDAILDRLEMKKYDVMIINFANPDMVGHSGRLDAAIRAVETTDICLGRILETLMRLDGTAIITADHGNAECMADADGNPHTAHTLNPVPLVLWGEAWKGARLRSGGKLCDIAPTLLQLLGLPQPAEMTGVSLIAVH